MSHFPKILALIPARAGSKGAPGKNMKWLGGIPLGGTPLGGTPLGGIPLIQYTIEAALHSKMFDKVLVSTDSPETAIFASHFEGISVPFLRPPHLATDDTCMADVARHALTYAECAWGRFEWVVLLQPTCPFRAPGLIDNAIRHLLSTNADSLVTVRKIPDAFNPHWAYHLADDQLVKTISSAEHAPIPCRQQLPCAYHRDGAIYITRASLIRNGQIMGGKIIPWFNETDHWVNIDTMADWARAENLLQTWKKHTPNTSSSSLPILSPC
ncbi:hypothetical protein GCM10010967_53060 [Dyadobacter beijingensis]|uniref:N-acylneuraminate cytidylyltransferase n=1 Tax=Dyadobacter beijingensis TaxID=365489 RepID=A0ABQ2II50_9BACT|nr:acylneuraminate cytidylyltransferase family protein [Dyadobacter beijingensis]GGN10573.1 hypothetical protein GCM10010967_53060 [Dyadobacter beijingensis]